MTSIGPTVATVDLAIVQGADFLFSSVYSQMVGGVKTAVDLTGWTAQAQIRRSVGGELYLQVTPITLGADGSIGFIIPAATTEAVEWNTRYSGVWDLELTSPTGVVIRLMSGAVSISFDVTRDV